MIRSQKDPAAVLAEVGRLGYHGGIALGRWYPDLSDCILVAVTEKRTRAEIDGLAAAYEKALERDSEGCTRVLALWDLSSAICHLQSGIWNFMYKLDQTPLLFESSRPGRATAILPESDVPDRPIDDLIPRRHRATRALRCPS